MQYAHVATLPCVLTFRGQNLRQCFDRQSGKSHAAKSQQPTLRSSLYCRYCITNGWHIIWEYTISAGSTVTEPRNALFHVLAISGLQELHRDLG